MHPKWEETLKRKLWKLDGQLGGFSGFEIVYGGLRYGMMFLRECLSWILHKHMICWSLTCGTESAISCKGELTRIMG